MATRKLEELSGDEVVAWLSSIALNKILGAEFAEQQIDGECLNDAEEEDFDPKDFVKARKMHWKKFWRNLKKAKKEGVKLAPVATGPAAAPAAAPDIPTTIATIVSPSSPSANVPMASATVITAVATPLATDSPPTPAVPEANVSSASRKSCRLTDERTEGLTNFSPIFGIDNTPLTTLDNAVAAMQRFPKYAAKFKHLGTSSFAAKMFADNFLAEHQVSGKYKSLTKEEIASINFFTHETPFYGALNASLRSKNRSDVKPFFPWMKLMLNGLYKLPLGDGSGTLQNVFRGVHADLKKSYPKGKKFVNWSFSSCTSSLEVLSSDQFLGQKGNRTLFTISARSVVDIRAFSSVQEEDELLLLPATAMTVKSCLDAGNGLIMIQLEQDIDASPLLDFVHPGLTEKKAIAAAKKQREDAAANAAAKLAVQHEEELKRQAELQRKAKAEQERKEAIAKQEREAAKQQREAAAKEKQRQMEEQKRRDAEKQRQMEEQRRRAAEEAALAKKKEAAALAKNNGALSHTVFVVRDHSKATNSGYRVYTEQMVLAKVESWCTAYKQGARSGCKITHVNGTPVRKWDDYTRLALGKRTFSMTLLYKSSDSHRQAVAMSTKRVTTCSSVLKPFANGSTTWYCDNKGPTCNRGSGVYLGVRWSNRRAGGSYDLCNNCAQHYEKNDDKNALSHTVFVVRDHSKPRNSGFTVFTAQMALAEVDSWCTAYKQGARSGCKITHVNGTRVRKWDDYTRLALGKQTFSMTLLYKSSDSHRQAVEMSTMRVTTCSSVLKPFANGSKTWYCDNKGPTCNRGSGLYHGVRWSNREAGGSYDLCNNCAQYYRIGNQPLGWKTMRQYKGNHISISDNTVTKTKTSWDECTAVVSDSVILQRGSPVKKRWSFTIKAGDQHTIGLVTSAYNAANDQYINKTNNGWGYYQGDGKKGHGGPANAAYGTKYKTGDIVDVQVCAASRELRFFLNGVDQGVAFRDLPLGTPLSGAASLYKQDSQIVYNGLVGTWQTSQQRKGKEISISDTTVTKADTSWAHGTAVVSDAVILQRGSRVQKRWSFTIKAGEQHTIGVVTAAYNAASDQYINKTNNGWGYYQADGKKGHGGPANKAYGTKYNTGDIVDVQVSAASRELRFFVNGVDQGVAFSDLPLDTPLYGAATLYNKDSQIVYNGSHQSLEDNSTGSPVSRALSVGDRVMVLASIDQCRRNTAAAGGWSWLAAEAAKCGQVGTVVQLHRRYPHPRAGYTVKFSDGDQQQYVHANLRLAPGRPLSPIGGPVSRALSVGDRVMVLASVDQCRRNTAAAGGWTWLAKEAAKCGQVGTVAKLYRSYPDRNAGYYVKFSDGDQQSYVHANLRLAP